MVDSNSSNCAVMFADISGSSALYSALGDTAADKLINQSIVMMSEITTSYYGEIIKTIGDEIMCCFDNADRAVKAALELQRSCNTLPGGTPVQLHIGLDFGSVLRRGHDLFGDTVNNAAYLTSIANRGKILLTQSLYLELFPASQNLCHEYDKVALKGHQQKTSIYRLLWEETAARNAGVTQYINPVDFTQDAISQTLELSFKGKVSRIAARDTPFAIGRNEGQSALFVASEFASRDHCRIISRHGRFILSDHSTNGTYVKPEGQAEIYLRREELSLLGTGVIGIGEPSVRAAGNSIGFRVL